MPFYIYSNWICDLCSKINGFKVGGIEFIPFVIILRKGASEQLKNHEMIHFKQQVECLFLFWYLIYLFNYLILRLKYKHYEAYKKICFENEAYKNESDLQYLSKRKLYAWIKYF